MKNDWIIDVLADLNSFAKSNGLPELATQLEQTALVASVELASHGIGTPHGNARPKPDRGAEEAGRRLNP